MESKKKMSEINWIETEAAAYSGVLSDEAKLAPDVAIFSERSRAHQYLRAEGLCLAGDAIDSLQTLRTQIARGQTEQALVAVHTALARQLAPLIEAEYRLELARIHAFHGDWALSCEIATDALKLPISPITRMTTLQCRSIGYYELAMWPQALRDIEQIRAIATLYPLAPAGFYAEVLKTKIDMARGLFIEASRGLEKLWESIKTPELFSIDRVQTLFRAEADLNRFKNQCSRGWVLAAHKLAQDIGDDLYAALARFELFAAGDPSSELSAQVTVDETMHPRIRRLGQTLREGGTTATTADLLSRSIVATTGVPFDQRPRELDVIVIPSKRMLMRLKPCAITIEPKSPQLFKAAAFILSREHCTKADLFGALFGSGKYAPHLHDSTLHQVISRLRRKFGLSIKVENAEIRIENALLVEDLV